MKDITYNRWFLNEYTKRWVPSRSLLSSGLLHFFISGALGQVRRSQVCLRHLTDTSFHSRTPTILSPQIHLLGNSSAAAGAGQAERGEVCPPVPHQAGVTLVCLFAPLSCFSPRRAITMGSGLLHHHHGRSPVPPSVCFCSCL